MSGSGWVNSGSEAWHRICIEGSLGAGPARLLSLQEL